jgi:hypothetical protein
LVRALHAGCDWDFVSRLPYWVNDAQPQRKITNTGVMPPTFFGDWADTPNDSPVYCLQA